MENQHMTIHNYQ